MNKGVDSQIRQIDIEIAKEENFGLALIEAEGEIHISDSQGPQRKENFTKLYYGM